MWSTGCRTPSMICFFRGARKRMRKKSTNF
jgi:hypothetical protein